MRKVLWITVALACTGVAAGEAKTLSVVCDQVNVRAQASKRAPVRFVAPRGYPLRVKKQQPHWLYVEDWRGKRGWVYRKLLAPIPTAIVRADTANIRRGPSRKTTPVTQATHGQIYKIMGERGQWVKLGYYFENEPVGWVHQDLVWGH